MKFRTSIIYSLAILAVALLSLFSSSYSLLIFSLLGILVVMLLDKLGKGIVLRETTALFYAFTCLLMPYIGYIYYTSSNPLARMWVKWMAVSQDIYFGFALPAISFFCFALTFPLSINNEGDTGIPLKQLTLQVRERLNKNHKVGIVIMTFGLIVSFFVTSLPAGLQFFATICFFASFAGLLYILFAPPFFPKKLIIVVFIAIIILNALNSGMFTIVAYMGITVFSFFYLGKRTNILRKFIFLVVSIVFFLVLQNTKKVYRDFIWRSQYANNKGLLFGELFIENLQRGDALLEPTAFFPVYSRTNQGFNVALVMRRMPAIVPHDGGNNLFRNFTASLVPRFLWPDKPMAGGNFNMLYYAGWNINGWSTNVGPLGEAYGSFGVEGGIFFMFILGLFIRFAYKIIFKLAGKNPLLICWLPVLFFQVTYSAETDTLQIMNSIFKTAFFIFLVYKAFPQVFPGNRKKQNRPVQGTNEAVALQA